MALGGSTNAVIHLIAMARRLSIPLDLETFDRISRSTPVIANLRPSGKYLMEDFYYAGGLRALMRNMIGLLHGDCLTVNGRPLAENLADADVFDSDVIRSLDNPLSREGGLLVLHGTLAPNGAVIKHTAADARLLQHRGRAVTFADRDDLAKRIDDPDLDVERGRRHRAQERRAGRGAGDARMGGAADPEEAAAEGRPRHAAHLGRAHERHQLRRLRAARLARGGARRTARRSSRTAT